MTDNPKVWLVDARAAVVELAPWLAPLVGVAA